MPLKQYFSKRNLIIYAIIAMTALLIFGIFKLYNWLKAKATKNATASTQIITNTVTVKPQPYKGKTVNFLGDSITKAWDFAKFKELTGIATVRNYGENSSTMVTGSTSFINRVESMNAQADLIIVYGGTNDYNTDTPIGSNSDLTTETFKGGLNVLVTELFERFPNARIMFMTPTQRNFAINEGTSAQNGPTPNGRMLIEYVDALIEIGGIHSIPVIDLYRRSGINLQNIDQYLYDGLHPNAKGYELLTNHLANFISFGYLDGSIINTTNQTEVLR